MKELGVTVEISDVQLAGRHIFYPHMPFRRSEMESISVLYEYLRQATRVAGELSVWLITNVSLPTLSCHTVHYQHVRHRILLKPVPSLQDHIPDDFEP